jgi:predicted transcriptional regulator
MTPMPKDEALRIRVSHWMKGRILALARARGESESVIVREALMEYLRKQESREALLNETTEKVRPRTPNLQPRT